MSDAELTAVVRSLVAAFDRRETRYALIGGMAVGLRGRPRATKDADFIVLAPALQFPGLLDDLVNDGFEIDVTDTIRRWPVERFTAFWRGRVRVDWMQPVLPLYATVMATAEPRPFADATVRVATAEGLILTKLVAFRPQDQADIETLLAANKGAIDLSVVRGEWAPFAASEPDRTAWLAAAVARAGLPPG